MLLSPLDILNGPYAYDGLKALGIRAKRSTTQHIDPVAILIPLIMSLFLGTIVRKGWSKFRNWTYDTLYTTVYIARSDPAYGTLSFRTDAIKTLLLKAHESYHQKPDTHVNILIADLPAARFHKPIHRPTRSWDSVVLPDGVKDRLLSDVSTFLREGEMEWYADKGIPHRRGYLLHGTPGSGKTTIATAIASQLALDIYVINPSTNGMDDNNLNKLFRNCRPGSMILVEDIDCAMPTRNSTSSDPHKKSTSSNSNVTLSGLLNAIDGIASQEHCVLFATTNHPQKLDDALRRPGRFDVDIAFSHATHFQAAQMFNHFFAPALDDDCERRDKDEALGDGSTDDETQQREDNREVKHEGKDCQHDDKSLAFQFADQISTTLESPNLESTGISMAAIQGYLLERRASAPRAVSEARDWAMKQREKARRSRSTKLKLKEADHVAMSEDGLETTATGEDVVVVPHE